MKEIIKQIEADLIICKREKENFDECSFENETGVLLTANDAIKILKVLKEEQTSVISSLT